MSFLNRRYQKNPAVAGFFFCRRIIATLLLGVVSLSVLAVEPYTAVYQVDADGMSFGKLERSLTQEKDGSFSLRTKLYSTGFWAMFVKDKLYEESNFVVNQEQVIPKRYHYKKDKQGSFIEETVLFDVSQNMISLKSPAGNFSFPYTGIELDKLLYQFKIREFLRQGKSKFAFDVVDNTSVRNYQFKVTELQSINTAIGEIEAIKVDWTNDERRNTTLWFAPSLNYLPVKIEQNSGGHHFSSTITSTSLSSGTASPWD